MRTINWSRVILGGLTAGVIINVFEFILNGVVLAKNWEVAIQGLGRPPIAGRQVAVFLLWSFVLWGLLVGVFGVWLYAAIRPDYDTGPKAAVKKKCFGKPRPFLYWCDYPES